jgi:hypothetical protein
MRGPSIRSTPHLFAPRLGMLHDFGALNLGFPKDGTAGAKALAKASVPRSNAATSTAARGIPICTTHPHTNSSKEAVRLSFDGQAQQSARARSDLRARSLPFRVHTTVVGYTFFRTVRCARTCSQVPPAPTRVQAFDAISRTKACKPGHCILQTDVPDWEEIDCEPSRRKYATPLPRSYQLPAASLMAGGGAQGCVVVLVLPPW